MSTAAESRGTWFNLTSIVGAGQIPKLWQRASEGDGNAEKVIEPLLSWSDKHRENAPTCIACDRGMGPLDICTFAVMQSHANHDVAIVAAFCMECAPENPDAVQAAMTDGLRKRGIEVTKLPAAGRA